MTELHDGVRALLETQLDSFEKLEIMHALHTAGTAMSEHELGAACQLGSAVVAEALADLERAQLIAREGGRIRCGHGCADPRFASLIQLYAEDPPAVLAALSSIAMRRIRSMAATAFVARTRRGDG